MTKRTKADLEREVAALRAQVDTLTAMNAKLVDALQHAATHPYVPPVVLPPAVSPTLPWPQTIPYVPYWKIGEVWCGTTTYTGQHVTTTSAAPQQYPTTVINVAGAPGLAADFVADKFEALWKANPLGSPS